MLWTESPYWQSPSSYKVYELVFLQGKHVSMVL
jgi:hypothetical protein